MDTGQLATVIAGLPLPTLAVRSGPRIVAANEAARNLLGQDIEEKHFFSVIRQPDLVQAVEACLQDATRTGARYFDRTQARVTLFDVSVARAGDVALLSFQDVTPKTEAEKMRRDFVANVSHELRTPLTSLIGFIETLRGPARDDPKARDRFLDIMDTEAGRMNRLIDDLLSLTRVEENERVRPTARVDIKDVLSQVIRNLNPLAVEADTALVPDFADAPLFVAADSDQLHQVFTNLIENALKYGPSGQSVRIAATAEPALAALRGAAVVVTVTDEGPGIAPEHVARLTERFYRVDNHRSRAVGGTGLGLAIAKHIINRHRGRLRIESTVGEGSRFSVLLPVAD